MILLIIQLFVIAGLLIEKQNFNSDKTTKQIRKQCFTQVRWRSVKSLNVKYEFIMSERPHPAAFCDFAFYFSFCSELF